MNWMITLLLSAALLCLVAQCVLSAPRGLSTALDEFSTEYRDLALEDKLIVSPANDYNSFVVSRAARKRHDKNRRKSKCLFRNSRGKCRRFDVVGLWNRR
eukprot:Seg1212.9 transcript_id=Seg1212.9/GoldUCD/mRNA.D3Y31 product="hypothetical protein" protein_id=Seg1212.9/GoldUCD/D3Y31